MKKAALTLLVGFVALAPALAVAQSSSSGSRPSGTAGSSSSGSSSSTTGSSSRTSGSPSAAPSSSGATDVSKYTTKADCEKAGGSWKTMAKKCEKKM